MTKPIDYVAHRGYQRKFPENTLIAYQAALDAGARFIETDVQLSADGVPFLYHDDDMARLSGQPGAISDYTADTLTQFSAGEAERFGQEFRDIPITSLAQLCQLLADNPSVTAFIEIKCNTIEHHGEALVYQQVQSLLEPIQHQCFIISFSLEFMHYCRERGWRLVGVVLHSWNEKDLPIVKTIKPDCIFMDHASLPANGDISLANTLLVIYEIDDPLLASSLVARGADMIETFDVAGMISANAHYRENK